MRGYEGGINDSARIFKKVRQRAFAATLQTLEQAASDTMSNLGRFQKYSDVTGNAYTSTTIGIFYKGKLVGMMNAGETADAPTRATLRKDEYYTLPTFYGGASNDNDSSSMYKGKYGKGGQWGPTLGPWAMHRLHPPKSKTWNFVVSIPVSYAGYNPRIVMTMQGIMDGLPDIVDHNVVTVEKAPYQGNLPF